MSMAQPELRRGWTTGACAAGAARAAGTALLSGTFPDPVTIRLPRGGSASFALARKDTKNASATAGVIKDAGDDPDVTHGALVLATVRRSAHQTVSFAAGEGVGTVTKPGLALAVGEPAINPRPRELIARELTAVAEAHNAPAGFHVTVSIPGGEKLAAQTSNARLGIEGGLSVLGTSGIVIPYSCASWVHSIHRGIDVARATGIQHIVLSTGRTSEQAACRHYGLHQSALIEMGDFAGATLTYLARHPVSRVTIAGGFGKMSKLARGARDLHSSRSSVDIAALASQLEQLGADPVTVEAARESHSAAAILDLAEARALPLATAIARRVREVAGASLAGRVDVDVLVIARDGRIIGAAAP